MELRANDEKNIEINVGKDIYLRYAIKTHFIKLKEDYIENLVGDCFFGYRMWGRES